MAPTDACYDLAAMTTSPQELLASFAWERIDADPDDVVRIKQSLYDWISAPSDDDIEELATELGDACRCVDRSAEGASPLLELLLDLSAHDVVKMPGLLVFEAACLAHTFGASSEPLRMSARRYSFVTQRSLESHDAESREGAAKLVGCLRLAEWSDTLHAMALHDVSGRARGVATMALVALDDARVGDLGTALARTATDERAQRVAALCLRWAARADDVRSAMSPELAVFADTHGHPAFIKKLYEEGWPLEPPDALRSPASLAPLGNYEIAIVVFASASLVMVNHPSRGNFTLRVPGTGLVKGDMVELAGFLPPPENQPRLLRFKRAGADIHVKLR